MNRRSTYARIAALLIALLSAFTFATATQAAPSNCYDPELGIYTCR
jgi:hypothetical protein